DTGKVQLDFGFEVPSATGVSPWVSTYIPNQSPAHRPFLVTRTVDEQGKQAGAVFGYFERRQAQVLPHTVQDLHALLQNGFRYDDVVNQQLDDMRRMIQRLLSEREHEAQ